MDTVHTGGHFSSIGPEDIAFLETARALGDRLLVFLLPSSRPQSDRAADLLATGIVDVALPAVEGSLEASVALHKSEVFVPRNPDLKLEATVRAHGGLVVYVAAPALATSKFEG